MSKPDFQLSDERLSDRAQFCFEKMRLSPSLSFPQIFSGAGELQGFYRFMSNSKTEVRELTNSVIEHTRSKLGSCKRAIAIHDTTNVKPSAKAVAIPEFVNGKGFFAHTSLLIDRSQVKRVYGAGAVHLWSRSAKRGYSGEQLRWLEAVQKVESDFHDVDLIHVMDREGDSCALWTALSEAQHSFIIRAKANRHVKGAADGSSEARLFDEMKTADVVERRMIDISYRKSAQLSNSRKAHPPRNARSLEVSISAKTISAFQMDQDGHPRKAHTEINVVRVFEESSHESEDRVEWFLLTNEPIETKKQITEIVDIYRARWTIEEFFKGLKTGCQLEERLLEDAHSWYRLFILCLPIAADILNLRMSDSKNRKPSELLTPTQLKILKMKSADVGKKIINGEDVKLQIARLGGHIKANGDPGWITMFRGYQRLYLLEQGWLLSKNKKM